MAACVPEELSDFDSDDDDLVMNDIHFDKTTKYKHHNNINNNVPNFGVVADKPTEYDFDLDIKELLDTGDVGMLEESITAKVVDVNHCLSSCYGWSLALYAASRADTDLLRWLVENGGKIKSSSIEPVSGFLVLSILDADKVPEQRILETATILIQQGESLEKRQSQMKTPLMLAASLGNIALVKFMVENEVDLNATDSQLWTALMYSADGGYGQVTRALLEAGAKADLVSAQGYTAADLAGISDNTSLQELIQKFSSMSELEWNNRTLNSDERMLNSEMASILAGCNLGQYQDLFAKHCIGISEFLVISESEMVDIGVTELGARKRMLEAQVQIHKRTWSKQSLPCIPLLDKIDGLRLTCPETGAILSTMEDHMKYLKASVAYIRLQLRDHGPTFIKAGSDLVPPSQLSNTLNDCRAEIKNLDRECSLLSTELLLKCGTESSNRDATRKPSSRLLFYVILGVGFCFYVKLGLPRPSLQFIGRR